VLADRSMIGTEWHQYEAIISIAGLNHPIYRWKSMNENYQTVQTKVIHAESCDVLQLDIAPNPFHHEFGITVVNTGTRIEDINVEILDINGRVVYSRQVGFNYSEQNEIFRIEITELDELSDGFYFV